MAVFDLDRPFVNGFSKKHATDLEFFSKIKCYNVITHSSKIIMGCECSGVDGEKVDMSYPTNLISKLPDDPTVEEGSGSDSKEEAEEHSVTCDLGEDEECDEGFVNFRGSATNYVLTTNVLSTRQGTKRGQHCSMSTAALRCCAMRELTTRNNRDKLLCDACSKEFSTVTYKNQCAYKGR